MIKVLWITNIILPDACEHMGLKTPVVGGWMSSLVKKLSFYNKIQLGIATVYEGKELKKFKLNNVDYYLLPANGSAIKYNYKLEHYWLQIKEKFQPDVVHIYGTEYAHGLSYIRACGITGVVISIQGLVGVIERYYYAGIEWNAIFRSITFRDILKMDTIFHQKQKFKKQGELEKEYIRLSKHVVGRTSWDKIHTWVINPQVTYHHCNEILRDEFYKHVWSFDSCTKYSIFLSQATYPIKGLHQVIKAVDMLRDEFPAIMIRVGGVNITKSNSISEKLKLSGYGKYLKKLLKKTRLEDKTAFLGPIDEFNMVKELKSAHVFICPSSIENSPNSLGEAQIIGTPSIGAYVGGIPDMIIHQKTGLLYRFEEIEMLANNIRTIFNNEYLAKEVSKNGIEEATIRHNVQENVKANFEIYSKIAKDQCIQ